MFKKLSLVLIFLLAVGCSSSSGFRQLGEWENLPDGTKLGAYVAKTPGHSGPDLTAVETWHCAPKCEKKGYYSGSAPGLAEVATAGAVGAALGAAGSIGGAAVLRPTRINERISNEQGQGQGQDQQQGQGQDLTTNCSWCGNKKH